MFREILELLRRLFWLSVEWHWRSCYSGLQGCLTILLFWALALTFAFWLFAGYLALIGRLASTSSGLVTVCYNLVGAAISFTEYIVELNEIQRTTGIKTFIVHEAHDVIETLLQTHNQFLKGFSPSSHSQSSPEELAASTNLTRTLQDIQVAVVELGAKVEHVVWRQSDAEQRFNVSLSDVESKFQVILATLQNTATTKNGTVANHGLGQKGSWDEGLTPDAKVYSKANITPRNKFYDCLKHYPEWKAAYQESTANYSVESCFESNPKIKTQYRQLHVSYCVQKFDYFVEEPCLDKVSGVNT